MEGNGRYLGVNNFCAECGVTSLLIGQMQGRLIPANATLGKQSQWQQEPPFKEALEQIKRSADTDCGPQTILRTYIAMKHGIWEIFAEEHRKEGKLCEWTLERIREAYEKVAMDDIGRSGIAQEILRKSTDCLRRIIAPVDGMGGVTLSHILPASQLFPFV